MFLTAVLSTVMAVQGERPVVEVGRKTLNHHDGNEWMDFLGIQTNEFPVQISEPAYAARLRIDVWEPGTTDKPDYSKIFGPDLTFKEKVPLNCKWKVSFLPPKLANVVPETSYPAVLEWQVGRPGEWAEDNPTAWIGRDKIDLPKNYLAIEGYTLNISPPVFDAVSFNEPVPIFHYMVTDSYGGQSKETSAETLKANPQAVHIIGWIVPVLERRAFGDRHSPAPSQPAKTDPPVAENQLLTVGTPAPEWAAPKVEGGVFGSKDLQGKIAVLNFCSGSA